jgi:CxxC motif-containing protein (DUF1111 family)
LLEAVEEVAILALADPNDANGDGISGRAALVPDVMTPGVARLGRFTAKSGQARVRDQIAAALNHDMGILTNLMPTADGAAAAGAAELSDADLDQLTRYVSLLGVSARRELTAATALRGEMVFQNAGCAACHKPQLTTGTHHPFAELRGQTIRPFTDLLLHDMGPGLADAMGEQTAAGAEWRTAPLWNIGLTPGVNGAGEAYLHDGRAASLEEAILWHGGEGAAAKENFRNLPVSDRAALVAFLRSL